MDTLTKDEIFSHPDIVDPTAKEGSKINTWFVTYFYDGWTEEDDAVVGLEEICMDLLSIVSKDGEVRLVKALINAEVCPETSRLHFHIAATFEPDYRPYVKLRDLFKGGKILAVKAAGVDCVRRYCSKRETRVGETVILPDDPIVIEQMKREYVGKWDGVVAKKDSVVKALEREKRLKAGRKNDTEKFKAIKMREETVKGNRETMKKIAGKVGQKSRWEMLRDEIKMLEGEIGRLNLVKPGESIHGLGIESEDEEVDEGEIEWPEEKKGDIPDGDVTPYGMGDRGDKLDFDLVNAKLQGNWKRVRWHIENMFGMLKEGIITLTDCRGVLEAAIADFNRAGYYDSETCHEYEYEMPERLEDVSLEAGTAIWWCSKWGKEIDDLEEWFESHPEDILRRYKHYVSVIERYNICRQQLYAETNAWRRKNGEEEIRLIEGISWREGKKEPEVYDILAVKK